ncbi:Copia protein, partial [Mucuna pruriens]
MELLHCSIQEEEFEMSMIGELKFFRGLQIKQVEDEIYIHQTKYIKKFLKKFNLEECKTMSTPIHPIPILSLDETDKKVDQTSYRVYVCVRFQSNPRKSRLTIIKHIFKYLKGTTNLGLCYKKSDNYKLKGHSDANFAEME